MRTEFVALQCKGPLCDITSLAPWTKDRPAPVRCSFLKIAKGDTDIAKYGWDWKFIEDDHSKLYPHCDKCLEHINK